MVDSWLVRTNEFCAVRTNVHPLIIGVHAHLPSVWFHLPNPFLIYQMARMELSEN